MSSNVFSGSFGSIFKHRRTNSPKYPEENATLELLKSSILVAFSGALRIHLAFLLLHIQSSILTCVAGGLIIYTVYTLDRALGSEEDTVNRTELNGSNKKNRTCSFDTGFYYRNLYTGSRGNAFTCIHTFHNWLPV